MAASEGEPDRGGNPKQMIGRYEILAQIAQGGMGSVYLARLEGVGGFQRLFAIKLLHPHLAAEERFISMLLDEARLAARIHHPNAVGILDVGECPYGHYLVMEYVDGFTLGDVLTHDEVQGTRRLRLGLRILADAMNGLDAAHRLQDDEGNPLQIVHRDVSPQNILVGVDGVGRITDFGVAHAAERITSSRPGTIKGKPCYMAPEQARGLELDARADIFALGIVLWEVLTDERLFYSPGGDTAALLKLLGEEIVPPSAKNAAVPEALDAVCMRALQRDPKQRYRGAREMVGEMVAAAQAAGLIAPSHEVGEALGTLFADKLESRRATLTTPTGAVSAIAATAIGSDVFDVPQMDSSAAPGATYARAHSTPPPEEPTRAARSLAPRDRSGERATSPEPTPPQAKPVHQSELELSPTPMMKTRDQLLLAATILMLVLAGGFVWLAYQGEPDTPEVTPAAPAAQPAAPQPAPVAPVALPEGKALPVEAVPPDAVEAPSQPEAQPTEQVEDPAGAAAEPKRKDHKRKARERRAPKDTARDKKDKKVFEKNPYLQQ
ncbi:MAG: serine/threonine-protein kinase [Myxococcales bacterium]|nr:serine/threonine-protein kinase [Myxococcales bacterium]